VSGGGGGRGGRYRAMFERLAREGRGAFVPFVVLGDPDPESSISIVRWLIASGADALELGLPFSDPVADGPVVQRSHSRALASGTRPADCRRILEAARAAGPSIPIGILAYANLVLSGGPASFLSRIAGSGADSVLVPDLPVDEAGSLIDAARRAAIAPVFIAPPNARGARLAHIAHASEGYVYVTSRPGVTGAGAAIGATAAVLIACLREAGSPPPLVGFGISGPEQVRAALEAGAAGAIAGSAVIRKIEEAGPAPAGRGAAISAFVRTMKAATTLAPGGPAAFPRPPAGR